MNRLAPAFLFALLLPGCPLTDEYYVESNDGQENRVLMPFCGDGSVNTNEACDGTDLGGATCENRGLGTGALTCTADCHFETSGCMLPPPPPMPTCGDGVAEGKEACDGSDLGGQTCASLGLDQGILSCTPSCAFDFSGCMPNPPVCGNGMAQAAEACDGNDLRGATCTLFGRSGTLSCASTCTFDFSSCTVGVTTCGDGAVQAAEACDGSDLHGQTCETVGYGPGTLGCTSACGFDTSQCGPAPNCGGSTGIPCCQPKAEVCDGVSNDCNDAIDEGGVCPDNGRGATFGGHVYLLYLYSADREQGGPQGGSPGGGRNQGQGGSFNQGPSDQQDYGAATTTCRAAGAQLGLGVELDLARIESAEENEFARAWIMASTSEEGFVWMGANDLKQEGRWVWGQDADAVPFFTASVRGGGTPVMDRFNDFTEGRPNSANLVDEDCGAFDSEFGWHWNDLDCGVPRFGVLCEQVD